MSESTIVQNRLIMVTWIPWSWKSFMAALLGSIYREIHSNLKIDYYWIQVSNDLYDINQIEKIKFNETKWCIILDEAWINMNSRKFMTDENQLYW
jgi:chloramphenicol 3-O-phosphotransferase